MFWKSDDTIPLHNFVPQKESIVARLHVVCWYIRFQDDNRNICFQDEPPIVLITTFDFEVFIKGHHVYKDMWTPKQGE